MSEWIKSFSGLCTMKADFMQTASKNLSDNIAIINIEYYENHHGWERVTFCLLNMFISDPHKRKRKFCMWMRMFSVCKETYFHQIEPPQLWLLQPNVVNIVGDHLMLISDNIFYPQLTNTRKDDSEHRWWWCYLPSRQAWDVVKVWEIAETECSCSGCSALRYLRVKVFWHASIL